MGGCSRGRSGWIHGWWFNILLLVYGMPPRRTSTPMVHVVVGGAHVTPWRWGGLRHMAICPVAGMLMSWMPYSMVMGLQVVLLLLMMVLLLLLLMVLLLRGVVGGRPDVGTRRHLAL